MNAWEEEQVKPTEISPSEVGESQLSDLIKAFIAPDGSDFGLTPGAFAAKERLARKQLSTGTLKIIFDSASDSTILITAQDWRKLSSTKS